MKIGRNEPCPCGSGKKYKQCCLQKESMSTEQLIRAAVSANGYDDRISDVLCNLNRYMQRKQWWGACHASCSALYVALSELGYSPKLCIGEMMGQGLYFDHSWIELNGKIIDMAISMTLLGGAPASEPILFGKNIRNGMEPVIEYGVPGRGIEGESLIVMNHEPVQIKRSVDHIHCPGPEGRGKLLPRRGLRHPLHCHHAVPASAQPGFGIPEHHRRRER